MLRCSWAGKVAWNIPAYNRAVADFEKLGAFYLGRGYDAAKDALAAEPLMYDSRDLTTHAVCVGMTGSGKTGLASRSSRRPRSTASRRS